MIPIFTHIIHNRRPSLHSNALEDRNHSEGDIIERRDTVVRPENDEYGNRSSIDYSHPIHAGVQVVPGTSQVYAPVTDLFVLKMNK